MEVYVNETKQSINIPESCECNDNEFVYKYNGIVCIFGYVVYLKYIKFMCVRVCVFGINVERKTTKM